MRIKAKYFIQKMPAYWQYCTIIYFFFFRRMYNECQDKFMAFGYKTDQKNKSI